MGAHSGAHSNKEVNKNKKRVCQNGFKKGGWGQLVLSARGEKKDPNKATLKMEKAGFATAVCTPKLQHKQSP